MDKYARCIAAERAEGFDRIVVEAALKTTLDDIPVYRSSVPGVIAFERDDGADHDWDGIAARLSKETGFGVLVVAACDWTKDRGHDEEAVMIAFDIPSCPQDYRTHHRNLLRTYEFAPSGPPPAPLAPLEEAAPVPTKYDETVSLEQAEGFDRAAAESALEEILDYPEIYESCVPGVIAFERQSGSNIDWDDVALRLSNAIGHRVVTISNCDWTFDDRGHDEEATLVAIDIPSLPDDYRNDYRNKLDAYDWEPPAAATLPAP